MGHLKHTQFTPKTLIISDLAHITALNFNQMNELNEIIENVNALSEALNININPLNL